MTELLYCAVDLGAESGRVVAGYFDGRSLRLQELHRFPNVPVRAGGTFYWDVLRLWNDIQDGLSKAHNLGPIAGIGVDTWGVDFGLLDKRGQLISNPVHYRDTRHEGYIEKAAQQVSKEEIYQCTGLQFLPFNTLFQLLALRDQNPYQLENAQSLLFVPDLLHFWLSGVHSNEYSIASTSQMVNARHRHWDNELLGRFGLPTAPLNQIAWPGTQLGTLRSDVATRTGLSADTPIIAPACHDTGSAIAAVPFVDGVNAAYLSSGTWSLMGLELLEPLITEETNAAGFTNEGGADGTIRFLKNIAGLWLVQECRRSWLRQGKEYSYAQLTEMAAQADADGPFVEPDDPRFSAPQDMPTAIREYCRETNQREPQTVGEVVRCCLDSLALKYRWTFEKLEELGGQPLDCLNVVGGGTQNQLLSQLTADCLGKPVVTGPVEGTAAGNILIQAMGSGRLTGLSEIREVVRNSFPTNRFEPRAEEKARWDGKFEKFVNFHR